MDDVRKASTPWIVRIKAHKFFTFQKSEVSDLKKL